MSTGMILVRMSYDKTKNSRRYNINNYRKQWWNLFLNEKIMQTCDSTYFWERLISQKRNICRASRSYQEKVPFDQVLRTQVDRLQVNHEVLLNFPDYILNAIFGDNSDPRDTFNKLGIIRVISLRNLLPKFPYFYGLTILKAIQNKTKQQNNENVKFTTKRATTCLRTKSQLKYMR